MVQWRSVTPKKAWAKMLNIFVDRARLSELEQIVMNICAN
jgi:hypothetical protein